MKYLYLVIILFLLSCQSTPTSEADTELAKDLCKCMQPLLEINKKTERLMQQGRMEEVHALFNQIERISNESESCKNDLEMKYGIIEGEKEVKAHQAMRGQCSDIARMIERSKQMEE